MLSEKITDRLNDLQRYINSVMKSGNGITRGVGNKLYDKVETIRELIDYQEDPSPVTQKIRL